MKTQIIDNWLDKDLVVYLEEYFLYNFPLIFLITFIGNYLYGL